VADTYDTILYEVDDPVAVVTLNRPDRLNAYTLQMGREIHDAFTRAEADRRVVGVVLTGAGRGFCAGADMRDVDLKDLVQPTDRDEVTADDAVPPAPLGYMLSLPKPVIAAINGPAAGMGAVLTLWTDLRFMAEEAIVTMSFSQRGTVAEAGSSWLLPRLIGTAPALDLLLSSRRVGADEALRLGLADRVAPAAELVGLAREYITDLARTCSPASLAAIKDQVYSEMHNGLAASAHRAGKLLSAAIKGGDIEEGRLSYLEKRPPQFARIGTE
jgi:enoyl-CoA hydratase/carnithine racemase